MMFRRYWLLFIVIFLICLPTNPVRSWSQEQQIQDTEQIKIPLPNYGLHGDASSGSDLTSLCENGEENSGSTTMPRNQPAHADCGTDSTSQSALRMVIVESSEQAAHTAEREQLSDEHDASDLDAQMRTADAAERSAATAERQEMPTLLLAIIGAFIAFSAFVFTVVSSWRASETARIQLRPYVAVSGIKAAWSVYHPKHVTLLLENTGQTPATFVMVSAKTRVEKLKNLPMSRVGDDKELASMGPLESSNIGLLGAGARDIEYSLDKSIYEPNLTNSKPGSDSDTVFVVYGIVRYGTIFGEAYSSQFMFYIGPHPYEPYGRLTRAPNLFLATYRKMRLGDLRVL